MVFKIFKNAIVEVSTLLNKSIEQIQEMQKLQEMQEVEQIKAKTDDIFDVISGAIVHILKMELKTLETKLQELVEQKVEYLNSIDEFTARYNLCLGDTIRSILNLKKEILYKKSLKAYKQKEQLKQEKLHIDESKQTADEMRATMDELEGVLARIDEDDENYDEISETYEELKEQLEILENDIKTKEGKLKQAKEGLENSDEYREYEEAKSAYEQYNESYEHIKESQKELSNEERLELKQLYKKAARLCHPDLALNNLEEQTHEMMQKLNEAYSKKDLIAVREILLALENGSDFELSRDSINDKELLKAKIEEYKKHIQTTQNEIEEIKLDETYTLVSTLDDWDKYFEELKSELEKEKKSLEDEYRVIAQDTKEKKEVVKPKATDKISAENSSYSKHILAIENPNFEKIRRYCQNLADENQADTMQTYLAENGKMHKALMYDALEQFIERLDGESITLIDWGCGQGVASMLMLDYIREKQLDITIEKVILIDDDAKALARAMTHNKALATGEPEMMAIDATQENAMQEFNKNKFEISLNLFANDKMPVDYSEIDFDVLGQAYFMCLSSESSEMADEIYDNITDYMEIDGVITEREAKIGRFQKFELVFSNQYV